MGQIDSLLKEIKDYNIKKENTIKSSKAAKLRHEIMQKKHTNEEWLELQRELRGYIESNPSENELQQLQGCGESLAMICSAIREGRMQDGQ